MNNYYDRSETYKVLKIVKRLFSDQKWKVSIVETHTNLIATAFTWAHEIGHAINMHHDFTSHHPFSSRNDTSKNPCSKVSGIMDYSYYLPQKWTSCSKEDLTKLYIQEMSNHRFFCLQK